MKNNQTFQLTGVAKQVTIEGGFIPSHQHDMKRLRKIISEHPDQAGTFRTSFRHSDTGFETNSLLVTFKK